MDVEDGAKHKSKGEEGENTASSFSRHPLAVSTVPDPLSFPIHLSQGHLNLLSTCPRRFQHTYLEQLATPVDPDQQERLLWGARFHWLVQQWQFGLPVEPLAKEDARLERWFSDFVKAAPEILKLDFAADKPLAQSEHTRTLEWQGYLLTVVYDLLLTDRQQAKILDWKTYPRPQRPDWLLQNWQSRLYPFVLVETSGYEPEQISMTYWFFQSDGNQAPVPQNYTFAYDRTQHKQIRQDLTQLLQQLTTWLEQYQAGKPFPQLALGARECDRCNFATRCDRLPIPTEASVAGSTVQTTTLNQASDFALPNLTDIQEVPL